MNSCYFNNMWDKEYYEKKQRRKQNEKRNRIRFDGVLYTHKRKLKTVRREYQSEFPNWDKIRYEKYVIPAKESYKNWAWLKGKANEKRWFPSRYNMWGIEKKYYPCQ